MPNGERLIITEQDEFTRIYEGIGLHFQTDFLSLGWFHSCNPRRLYYINGFRYTKEAMEHTEDQVSTELFWLLSSDISVEPWFRLDFEIQRDEWFPFSHGLSNKIKIFHFQAFFQL